MTNESPPRGQNAAGVKADEFQQSTASLLSFQRIARAIAAVGESTTPLDAALAYAKEGWPVFPCSSANKRPHTVCGFKDATTELRQVRNWWDRWPEALIGLPCGTKSGVFALDVDVEWEKNIDGFVALSRLEKQHGALPETLRSVTPRGGSHYFFHWRDGIKNSASKLGEGLDIRGEGGYVILPPSHRFDGKDYTWAETSAPTPAEPPEWLVDLLLAKKPATDPQLNARKSDCVGQAYARAALERECEAVAIAQVGTRNDVLNRASYNLHQFVSAGELAHSEVRDRLYAAASGLVRDDGADTVHATITSGATAGLKIPRVIPQRESAHDDANHPCSEGAGSSSLEFCDIASWANTVPPEREWAVPDRFPLRNIALLSGEGAAGKSILATQLAAAHVLGKDWLGTLPEFGPAIYVNAEDEEGELHRRLAKIAGHFGASLTELKNDLDIAALAGKDSVLGYPDRTGRIIATSLFHKLAEAARTIRPKLIVLDTSADIFAGNENDRSQVRQFISLLRNMAIEAGAAVIICAHPSLTGMSSGSGLSGSTAWHNSVRARAYLRAATTKEGAQPDKDLRLLEFMKSNYGPVAESVTVRWRDGVFVLEPKAGSLETAAANAKADEAFMQVLNRFCRQGRNASPNPGRTYAPSLFASEPEAAGLTGKNLTSAMGRLLSADRIHVVKEGPPSRLRNRLAVVAAPHSNDPTNDVPTPSNGVCVPPPYTPQPVGSGQGALEAPPAPPGEERDKTAREEDGLPADAKVLGTAPGQRCELCGAGRDVFLIRRRKGGEAAPLHKECAAKAWVD
jgi:hypothetical protein